MKWYIVHTYSGFEDRVKETLRQRAEALEMGDAFGEIHIPTETIVEYRSGQEERNTAEVLPGIHPGGDGHVRRGLACGQEHPQGHRVRRKRQEPDAPDSGRGRWRFSSRWSEPRRSPSRSTSSTRASRSRSSMVPFNNFTGVVEEVNLDRNTLEGHGHHLRSADAGRARLHQVQKL